MNLGLRRDLSVVRVVSCSTSTSDPKSQNSISPASGEYLRKMILAQVSISKVDGIVIVQILIIL